MNSVRHVQSPFMGAQGNRAGRPGQGLLHTLVALAVGAVFIYAGALKVWDPVTFGNDINNFRILPYPLSMRLAFYLPWLEILGGLAVLTGRLRAGAIAILMGLMVIFVGATIAAEVRGLDLNCGCFGRATENLRFATHMVIDAAILAALLLLARWEYLRLR